MAPERIVLSQEKLATAVGDRWSEQELSEAASLLARADGRFPAGVRTLPEELIRAVQRERLLAAMIAGVTETGYSALTVQDVLGRAGISRPTFYEQFDDKEDCFLAAFDATVEQLRKRVDEAAAGGGDWQDRLRRAIAALLAFVAEDPPAARTAIVEARASSPAGLRRRDEVLDGFASRTDALVREELAEPPSAIVAAGVVGGIESVLYARLQKGELEDLDSLLPSLMYFAVLAYTGQDEARKQLR